MELEGGVWEYSKNFSLNEKLLACALYKVAARSINTNNPMWRGLGNLRLSGLIEALNLSEDMIHDAQVSKTVWQRMSRENKAQIFYSLIDLIDIVDIHLKSEELVNHISGLGLTKESFKNVMSMKLDNIIRDVIKELDAIVMYDIKKRSVHCL